MAKKFIEKLSIRYHEYVSTFRDGWSVLPKPLRFKLDHSERVAVEAQRLMIADRTFWDKRLHRMGDAAALLHDTARYVQYHAFGTFRDSESFDHAEASVEIIQKQGWLAALAEEDQRCVLTAVRLHNKRDVPPSLTEAEAYLTHLVRDADKLDIFYILEKAVTDGSLATNPEIAWGLQMEGAPNPKIIKAVSKGKTVDYDEIRVFADFVLIQVGWLNGGLHFTKTAQLAVERKTLEFREALLKTLTDDHAGIERCCAAAKAALEERAG